MKKDFDDIEFKQLFKEKAHQPGKNPWFTRRVLNRLPEKEKSESILSSETWVYSIGLLLCVVCWGFLLTNNYFEVITVKSLIYTIGLIVGSFILTIQTIRSAFSY